MRGTFSALLMLLSTASPTSHSRYQRSVTVPAAGQACAVLSASIYAHAAGSLADLRLRSSDGKQEIPYVLTTSQSATGESEPAQVMNLRGEGRAVAFDLAMPHRAYTDVDLDLAGSNFLATAVVTGHSAGTVPLGSYTIFDLTSQQLSRDTTLPLQESNFPTLHIRLVPSIGSPALTPEMVRGATVPPSREAQTLYTAALTTPRLDRTDLETRATFVVPSHLPIERVAVTLASGFTKNFRREIRVTSHALGEPAEAGEQVTGTIDRVHLRKDGLAIRAEHLTIPATLGANLQRPAEVQVVILNGGEPALAVSSITLETREHQICFPASDARGAMLFYGDSKLEAPGYAFAAAFHPNAKIARATLGPEQVNPGYQPRGDDRPLMKRHPRLIYLGAILLICLAALIALWSGKLHV